MPIALSQDLQIFSVMIRAYSLLYGFLVPLFPSYDTVELSASRGPNAHIFRCLRLMLFFQWEYVMKLIRKDDPQELDTDNRTEEQDRKSARGS